MVINITCLKIPGSGFISAAFEYPSITNKEIILVLFFPLPSDQIGGGFLVCYFFLSFFLFFRLCFWM